ncbi:Pre-mRNA-splicing factor cwc26 [Mortierella sp. GBA35]|nr:Pre-mRNA-splicing factor cwc26 [Mortierella sp. GBA35]
MSSTQDYLKKYMSKPTSLEEHKKRKLKKKKTTKTTVKKGNFAIHDEDEVSWTNAAASDSDDDLPVIQQPKAPSYKSSSNSWATVREGEPEPTRESILKRNVVPEWDDVENEDERPSIAGIVQCASEEPSAKDKEGNRIEVQVDSTRKQRTFIITTSKKIAFPSASEVPITCAWTWTVFSFTFEIKVAHPPKENALEFQIIIALLCQEQEKSLAKKIKIQVKEAGFGLQSAQQVKRDMIKQREQEDRMRAMDSSSGGREAETIYRDARGRKVDRVQEKLEAAEAARREIEKQERQMEWGKGLVQREAEEEKKKREQEEKLKPLARYKDDKDLNEELKERDRWNDPAAMFLSGTKKSKKSAPKFPLYQGNFPSNRFNIRPGYRWDGVDRSTGFEKDYIQVCA